VTDDAILLQIAGQREQIAALERLAADLTVKLTALKGQLTQHGRALSTLQELQRAVQQLSEQLSQQTRPTVDGEDEEEYTPTPVVPWWRLLPDPAGAEARAEAVGRLQSWVEQVYRPLYGHLAQLGDCWTAHPLALTILDWLSELWSVLYLNTGRTARQVGQQAELGTRILPAAAALLAAETRNCPLHRSTANGRAAGNGHLTGRQARP
jgi:hypothetical protein